MCAKDEKQKQQIDDEEKQQLIKDTTQETKAALEKIVNVTRPKYVASQSNDSRYIKYKPSQQSATFNSGAKERIIRMVEMPVDPLEPPKLKHKRVPKGSGSPPVPLMHSPPRPVTVKDQQDWKIPPCISNWKNPKGYTIPLDKRLAANGRGLQDVQINDNFARLYEVLYVAEQKAKEAVAMRKKVRLEMAMKKQMELRELARKVRAEKNGAAPPTHDPKKSERSSMDVANMIVVYESTREEHMRREKVREERRREREESMQREKIREERRRERERERRLEAKDAAVGKKSNITRDRDRDISEKVALGMATTGKGGEVQYDQRLFNQEKGMGSGFATDDDAYNVYDKGIFTAQPTMSTLYRPKKDADSEMYCGADEQMEKIMKTYRFKPDKAFTGASEKATPGERPVEFEKVAEESDPFGLDMFLTEVKKGKKAKDQFGSSGTMKATAGSMRDGHEGSSSSLIAFEKEH